ncbi:MAG: precorrin-3B synthase [Pseudomonadota bacterium]
MSRPAPKGWCPGAWTPMTSGDGLIVRVRPRHGRLRAADVRALCDLAEAHGNGLLEVTRRANLQLRGVTERAHPSVLAALETRALLDATAEAERRRNVIVAPFWKPGDLTARLSAALLAGLEGFPELPVKFGVAVDTGAAPVLRAAPADIRLERDGGGLVLRADGAASGRRVAEGEAVAAAAALARWFAETAPATGARRMAAHLAACPLPPEWTGTPAPAAGPVPAPGETPLGPLLGIPFGQIDAGTLRAALAESEAAALRLTPWRMVLFEGGRSPAGLIGAPGDPRLSVDACPGAPACASAAGPTRPLARALAGRAPSLHVSGCAKGCARSGPAAVTLVAQADGRFDLVEGGHAWDEPGLRGLTEAEVLARFGAADAL